MAVERFIPLSVYYLRVTLKDSKPPIWRDILVPSDLTLEALHYVIQIVMGWGNCHVHQFIAEKVLYNEGIEQNTGNENVFLDTFDQEKHDRNEKKYTVAQLLTKEEATIIYEYDLGDSWTHQIKLKKILPVDANAHQPRCIKGEKACPPEDCGGIWGYTDMLEMLRNSENHEDSENSEKTKMLTWSNEDFNPDHFDIEAVNRTLRHLLVDDLDSN
jgi:hypothetical protein